MPIMTLVSCVARTSSLNSPVIMAYNTLACVCYLCPCCLPCLSNFPSKRAGHCLKMFPSSLIDNNACHLAKNHPLEPSYIISTLGLDLTLKLLRAPEAVLLASTLSLVGTPNSFHHQHGSLSFDLKKTQPVGNTLTQYWRPNQLTAKKIGFDVQPLATANTLEVHPKSAMLSTHP